MYQAGAIDVRLKDWIGCPGLTNGTRDSGELINGVGEEFMSLLDTDARLAPDPTLGP